MRELPPPRRVQKIFNGALEKEKRLDGKFQRQRAGRRSKKRKRGGRNYKKDVTTEAERGEYKKEVLARKVARLQRIRVCKKSSGTKNVHFFSLRVTPTTIDPG